jgi:hypothetical protein
MAWRSWRRRRRDHGAPWPGFLPDRFELIDDHRGLIEPLV